MFILYFEINFLNGSLAWKHQLNFVVEMYQWMITGMLLVSCWQKLTGTTKKRTNEEVNQQTDRQTDRKVNHLIIINFIRLVHDVCFTMLTWHLWHKTLHVYHTWRTTWHKADKILIHDDTILMLYILIQYWYLWQLLMAMVTLWYLFHKTRAVNST